MADNTQKAVPTVSITLTAEQVRAMNAIVRSQKRNASDSAQALLNKTVNNFVFQNFKALAEGIATVAAKQYDGATITGFKHEKTRDEYIAEQTAATKDILEACEKLAKK